MKYTNLAGLLMVIGGFLIIFNFVFKSMWTETFMANIVDNNISLWGGIILIAIAFGIMLITKKDTKKK